MEKLPDMLIGGRLCLWLARREEAQASRSSSESDGSTVIATDHFVSPTLRRGATCFHILIMLAKQHPRRQALPSSCESSLMKSKAAPAPRDWLSMQS